MPTLRLPRRLRGLVPRSTAPATPEFVPADPATLGVPLDPALGELRAMVARHGARLWLRRSVRRAWYVLAAVTVAGLNLAVMQRLFRSSTRRWSRPRSRSSACCVLALVVRARRPWGRPRGAGRRRRTGDRVASRNGLRGGDAGVPDRMPPPTRRVTPSPSARPSTSSQAEAASSGGSGGMRSPRRGAWSRAFRPRLASVPALVALAAGVLVLPAVLLPNPQDAVIAQNRQVREEASARRSRIDDVAKDLEAAAPTPTTRARGSPMDCASSPSACATTRASWTSTSPGWARWRTRCARSSIPRTSRRRRRLPRSRARCHARPPTTPRRTRGATRRRPGTISRTWATSWTT